MQNSDEADPEHRHQCDSSQGSANPPLTMEERTRTTSRRKVRARSRAAAARRLQRHEDRPPVEVRQTDSDDDLGAPNLGAVLQVRDQREAVDAVFRP